ncbi:hypothetical protein BDR26DRAFT_880238 [Obelidium mucronatum]|nr:hypothetical protein BDR26DRAFT_880238 [Obelidium mucronatum]
MGQRHQAFLIRRFRTGKVYSVASLYHQWLYGRGPLTATAAFCRSLAASSTEATAALLAFEATASPKDIEGFSVGKVPFIDLLFITAFGVHGVMSPELITVAGPHFCDNNDGVSIIDISDIGNPRYCFVNIDHLEGCLGAAVPVNLPLSAEMYVRAYYPQLDLLAQFDPLKAQTNADTEEYVLRAIEGLAPYKMLSLDDLKEAWPYADWKSSVPAISELSNIGFVFKEWLDTQAKAIKEQEVEPQQEQGETTDKSPLPLLESSALAIMSLEDGDANADKVEAMLALDHVRKILWDAARTGKGTLSLFVMGAMLADTSLVRLDLQGVTIPSYEFLVEATTGCPSLQELDMSGHAEVTNEVLIGIGSNCRLLQKVLLFGCKKVTNECYMPLTQMCPLLHYIYADDLFKTSAAWKNRTWSALLAPYKSMRHFEQRVAIHGAGLHGAPLARLLLQWIKNVRDGVVDMNGRHNVLTPTFSGAGSGNKDTVYHLPIKERSSLDGGSPVALNQSICIVIGYPGLTLRDLEVHLNEIIFKYAFLVRKKLPANVGSENKMEVEVEGALFTAYNVDEFLMESYQEIEGGSELVNERIRTFRNACREELGMLFADVGELEYVQDKEELVGLIEYRSVIERDFTRSEQ